MGMAAAGATISSMLPLHIRFSPGFRFPKCSKIGTSKFPKLVFPPRLRCLKPNARTFVPISITMAERGITTVAFASRADPQNEGDPSTSKGEATRDSSTDGPPISTILAGLVVFLLLLWLMGYLVLWILRLFIR